MQGPLFPHSALGVVTLEVEDMRTRPRRIISIKPVYQDKVDEHPGSNTCTNWCALAATTVPAAAKSRPH